MKLEFEYRTLRTPIDTINLLTAGGLKMGTMTEFYGPNASGKSSIAYQMAKYFQEDYPNGLVILIDSETSSDYVRLKSAFELDLSEEKFDVKKVSSLEEGFNIIMQATKDCVDPETGEEKPILIIWDTIAVARPAKEMEVALDASNMMDIGINSGGMNLRSRVIEHGLATSMTSMFGKPVTVLIINQVRTTNFGSYTGPTTKHSSGGNALKHYMQYKFYVNKKGNLLGKDFDKKAERQDDKEGTKSIVEIIKSKFCPAPIKIPIDISDKLGGIIVQGNEILSVAKELGVIKVTGGWCKIPDLYPDKSFRGQELTNNDEIKMQIMELVARYFREAYFSIDALYEELGNPLGKPEKKEAVESIFKKIRNRDPFASFVSKRSEESANELQ